MWLCAVIASEAKQSSLALVLALVLERGAKDRGKIARTIAADLVRELI